MKRSPVVFSHSIDSQRWSSARAHDTSSSLVRLKIRTSKKKKKNWDEKRGNDCALAILAMEGDRGTRAISCERVVQASILLDETRVVRVPLQHTRMHRKRENENQETGECLSDDKSIHILLLNSSVRENTRYSRKNASELHKSLLVFFLFVCFFFRHCLLATCMGKYRDIRGVQ